MLHEATLLYRINDINNDQQQSICFFKYHSLKNDFVLIEHVGLIARDVAQKICCRKTGIGADGIIFFQKIAIENYWKALVQNADGSNGEFSGNGIRCLAGHIFEKYVLNEIVIQIAGKEIFCRKKQDCIETRLPLGFVERKVQFSFYDILYHGYFVMVGNPHFLIFSQVRVINDALLFEVKKIASDHNISWIDVQDNKIFITTYERGVGFTESCSSAILATMTLLHEINIHDTTREYTFITSGGTIDVCIGETYLYVKAAVYCSFYGFLAKDFFYDTSIFTS